MRGSPCESQEGGQLSRRPQHGHGGREPLGRRHQGQTNRGQNCLCRGGRKELREGQGWAREGQGWARMPWAAELQRRESQREGGD